MYVEIQYVFVSEQATSTDEIREYSHTQRLNGNISFSKV